MVAGMLGKVRIDQIYALLAKYPRTLNNQVCTLAMTAGMYRLGQGILPIIR